MRPLAVSRKKLEEEIIAKEVRDLAQKVREHIHPSAIYLFGSAAEGGMRVDSDIDILMVFESAEDLRLSQKKLKDAYPLGHRAIDIVWMTREEFDRKKDVGGVAYIAKQLNMIL